MIQPTRTNLLLLEEKAQSVTNSTGILKARRQALIREFLATTLPFLRSREEVRNTYGKAIGELGLSLGNEGRAVIESIAAATLAETGVEITERSIWGLRYRDVVVEGTPVRTPPDRDYDYHSTTPHLEECIHLFERVVESMLQIAAFESKLKRLGDEILSATRKVKVLEEKILPDLRHQMRAISSYISEREREAYYRLKRFKKGREHVS